MVFQREYNNQYSHQQCYRIPVVPHTHQHLVLCHFFTSVGRVITSMSFNKCIDSYNYHHNQKTEQFQPPKELPWYPLITTPSPLYPTPSNQHLFSITIVLSFHKCHINGIIHCAVFETGFFTKHTVSEIHSSCVYQKFVIFCWIVAHSNVSWFVFFIHLFPVLGHYK